MTTAAQSVWIIIAVAGDGEEARLEESPHSPLRHLLQQAVRRLYGEHANPDGYELLIGGTVQTNLNVSLIEAGLSNDAEVVVLPKNVSRG